MTRILRAALASLFVAAFAAGILTVYAQTDRPVTVTSDPVPMKAGDEGVVTVHVVAQAAMSRLEISIVAGQGVTLVEPVPPATLTDVREGQRHDLRVRVRLGAPFGLLSVFATAVTPAGRQPVAVSLPVGTPPPAPTPVPAGIDEDLADLILVRASGGNAVVRFGQKSMMVVTKGDRLGRNRAEIVEVTAGQIVLDEVFIDRDGRPNRARVTLKEGEKGGSRVLLKPGEEPPPATRLP